MAGHSKWANIRYRKAAADKKRSRLWSKISRAISAAAKAGGPDPATNLALRAAIDEARYANMPKDTISRLIDRATSATAGEDWETVRYEGYGPGGVAILVDSLTDNRMRTVTDVRTTLHRHGGSLGSAGCVAYLFEPRGQIVVPAAGVDEQTIVDCAAEAGADDVLPPEDHDGVWVVLTDPAAFESTRLALESAGVPIERAELTMMPTTTIELQGDDARRLLELVEALEDHDDVQKVYTNALIPDDALGAPS